MNTLSQVNAECHLRHADNLVKEAASLPVDRPHYAERVAELHGLARDHEKWANEALARMNARNLIAGGQNA
jgi:hypothetical protein